MGKNRGLMRFFHKRRANVKLRTLRTVLLHKEMSMTTKTVVGIIVVVVIGIFITLFSRVDSDREWWQTIDVPHRFDNPMLQRYFHIQVEIHKYMDEDLPLDAQHWKRLNRMRIDSKRQLDARGISTLHVMCFVNHDYHGYSFAPECPH